VPAPATGWNIRVPDDAAHLNQRRIGGEAMPLQHDLERAVAIFVSVFGAAHVERVAIQLSYLNIRRDEEEFRPWVDELRDQPRAGRAVDVR
jgi:DNA-binding IclR family transcriptional regulator